MYRFLTTFFLAAALLVPGFSKAAAPAFTSLSEQDFEDVSKEFSGNFMHHSVQGAGTLGSVFGFEFGLIGGQQASPKISDIAVRSGGSSVPNLYHAGLLGVISVPLGITAEVVLLPKTSASDASFQTTSLALKYTMNPVLFNLAVRGFYSSSAFSFTQGVGNTVTVEDTNKVTGLQLLISPKLPIVEPYAGIGYASATNSLTATGGSIFLPGYTTSQSMEKTPTSTQILLGVTANLLFFHLGAEYSNAFGTSAYTGKLAFGF